ncbi:hypothetical protein [Robiginitomaculum antarcticum]|uniref:hypothetical protein n=1 Tax=Robiginitomaculum antarcticum TaxID=437507 RepID=UPI0003605158|nr:hypothetical protein [Robiginitomaculum antarcticum]
MFRFMKMIGSVLIIGLPVCAQAQILPMTPPTLNEANAKKIGEISFDCAGLSYGISQYLGAKADEDSKAKAKDVRRIGAEAETVTEFMWVLRGEDARHLSQYIDGKRMYYYKKLTEEGEQAIASELKKCGDFRQMQSVLAQLAPVLVKKGEVDFSSP